MVGGLADFTSDAVLHVLPHAGADYSGDGCGVGYMTPYYEDTKSGIGEYAFDTERRQDMEAVTGHPSVSVDEKLRKRIKDLTEWLQQTNPGCFSEQRHLDSGTTERSYWHYGYLCAVRDIRLLRSPSGDLPN